MRGRVGQPAGLPEARVGAGGGEARDGVDLVDEHTIVALDEEIHPRHAGAVDGLERSDGERATCAVVSGDSGAGIWKVVCPSAYLVS